MPVALIGAAIGGVATIAASSSSNRAVDRATQAQQDSAREQNALTREIYTQNVTRAQPFVNTGLAANDQINALLGLDTSKYGAPQPTNALAGFAGTQPSYDGMGYTGEPTYARRVNGDYTDPSMGYGAMGGQPQPPMPQPGNAQSNALAAYDRFKEYGGYTTRLNEGNRNINAGYAGRGLLQSGAAQKALLKYGQDYASGEFGNYMGYLGGQQGVGLSANNALSGVSTNFANATNATSQNAANAVSNGALAKASNNNALMGNLAGIAGNAFGALGSSYAPTSGTGGPIVNTNRYNPFLT